MLQQTGAARVERVWPAFMERFPTARSCADRPAADVVRAWAGLGYNRRALNLHRAAQLIAAHGFPDDLRGLVALPGVGPYTARAVLAFACGHDVAALDVNVTRVVSRVTGATRPHLQEAADALVPPGGGWQWNQAMMDLGATVCTARTPQCAACPLSGSCVWFRSGGPDPNVPGPRQSRFEGSDRQGRGRLLDALRDGPVGYPGGLAAACGWPSSPDRALAVAGEIIEEGFAVVRGGVLELD